MNPEAYFPFSIVLIYKRGAFALQTRLQPPEAVPPRTSYQPSAERTFPAQTPPHRTEGEGAREGKGAVRVEG